MSSLVLTNVHTLCAEVFACLRYLLHKLLMRLRYVFEGEDAPAELEKEVCAERDESPKGKLRAGQYVGLAVILIMGRGWKRNE